MKHPDKLRVLIVEDSDVVALRIRNMLGELQEVRVVGTASSYEEALSINELMSPQVVLLDIKLKGKNGVDVLKHLKHRNQKIRVVMLTNYSDLQHRIRCKEAGADYFFDKTTEFEKVPDVLLSLLEQDPPGTGYPAIT